jgi:hypothetical protein
MDRIRSLLGEAPGHDRRDFPNSPPTRISNLRLAPPAQLKCSPMHGHFVLIDGCACTQHSNHGGGSYLFRSKEESDCNLGKLAVY